MYYYPHSVLEYDWEDIERLAQVHSVMIKKNNARSTVKAFNLELEGDDHVD